MMLEVSRYILSRNSPFAATYPENPRNYPEKVGRRSPNDSARLPPGSARSYPLFKMEVGAGKARVRGLIYPDTHLLTLGRSHAHIHAHTRIHTRAHGRMYLPRVQKWVSWVKIAHSLGALELAPFQKVGRILGFWTGSPYKDSGKPCLCFWVSRMGFLGRLVTNG